eukprot:gene6150-11513_t
MGGRRRGRARGAQHGGGAAAGGAGAPSDAECAEARDALYAATDACDTAVLSTAIPRAHAVLSRLPPPDGPQTAGWHILSRDFPTAHGAAHAVCEMVGHAQDLIRDGNAQDAVRWMQDALPLLDDLPPMDDAVRRHAAVFSHALIGAALPVPAARFVGWMVTCLAIHAAAAPDGGGAALRKL